MSGGPAYRADTLETVRFLAARAGAGPVLELGPGTGRVALPLAEGGLEVHGIEASEAMLAQLEAKPGADRLRVRRGDFSRFQLEERFSLAYAVSRTLFELQSQDEQVDCFLSVAQHLRPGGCFVVDVPIIPTGQAQVLDVRAVSLEGAAVALGSLDRCRQELRGHNLFFTARGVEMQPLWLRYATPAELSLMGRLAG